MKEYVFEIRQALVNGLRPNSRTTRNSPLLEYSLNLLPYEGGVRSFTPITEPFADVPNKEFPYPQLLHGQTHTFLCYEDSLHHVYAEGTSWLISSITLYSSDSPEDIVFDIPAGGMWQLIDARDFVMLTNGACVVYNDPETDKFLIETDVLFNSGTFNNGRVIVGGFVGSAFFKESWHDIIFTDIQHKLGFLPSEIGQDKSDLLLGSHKPDGSYILWSSVGSVDFPLWLLRPYKINKESLLTALRRNEWGLVPLPSKCTVLCILPMGDRTIIYTNNGIYALSPVTGGDFPSYKLSYIASFGIQGSRAVAGDSTHVFVTTSGKVGTMTQEGIKLLGYEEYTSRLSREGRTPVVSYDSQENIFYIAGNYKALALTETGLTYVKQAPHSIVGAEDATYGIITDLQYNKHELVTNVFDLDRRAVKTISCISVSCADPSYITASVFYRFSRDESFRETRAFELNKEGNCYPRIAGTDFKIHLKGINYERQDIDAIFVKWQSSDKRAIRGHAGSTDSRTD